MHGRKFRRLVLHIGLEKTGTTSIQAFLARNGAALSERGVFVPRSLGHENHKLLAASAFPPGSRDIAVTSAGIGPDAASVEDFRARLVENFCREAEAALAAGATTAIVTSEDLSRLFDSEAVGCVIGTLAPWTEAIEVVAFIRRQDLLAASRYYSLVIGGSSQAWVLPDAASPIPRYYDYAATMALWGDALGDRNVSLVRFPEDPRAEGFNSVLAFCNVAGIDPEGFDTTEQRHVSLDAVNQIIIQNFNAMAGRFDPEAMRRLTDLLARENDPSHRHFVSAGQARDFFERCRPGNDTMFARFGNAAAFSDDFSMYPDTNLRPRYQQIAIQRLLGHVGAVG